MASNPFAFANVTEEGATYTPWTDGWAVGFKVTAPGKPDRYVILNPSQTDSAGESNVFLYLEQHDPSAGDFDNPVCYVNMWDEAGVYATPRGDATRALPVDRAGASTRYVITVHEDTDSEMAAEIGPSWCYDINVDADDPGVAISSASGWEGPLAAIRAAADDIARMREKASA